ncbi:ankyrin, partial [Dendrothele bispora CBS 962.96]
MSGPLAPTQASALYQTQTSKFIEAIEVPLGKLNQGLDTKIQDIRKWIGAPDPSTNFTAACNKMTEGTGFWLVNDKKFQEWKSQGGLFWLQGKAGSGKTFLCTTAINTLKGSGKPVFYFYFDSLDSSESKTKYEGLVASLLTQIGTHSKYDHTDVESLYKDNEQGHTKAPAHNMKITIQETLKKCPETQATYIFLDAMDECKNDNQPKVKNLVQDLLMLQNIHIFVTSRHSGFVSTGWNMSLDSLGGNEDILVHINKALTSNESFKGLEEEIQAELLEKADRQIRWVDCQLTSLQELGTKDAIRKALQSLPTTLEDIYDHALKSIHKYHVDEAKHLLQWILFSHQPLTIKNVIEVLAIDLKRQTVNKERNEQLGDNLHKIISSTIVVITQDEDNEKKVQLAHPSVKEFLIERESGHSDKIHVEETLAHIFIAQSCIIYLLHIVQVESVEMAHAKFPLTWYAVHYWAMHVEKVENLDEEITKLVMSLLKFQNHILNEILCWDKPDHDEKESCVASVSSDSALYYASLRGIGVGVIVRLLLAEAEADVNAQGGEYGNSLQAASYRGNERIVKLLVDAGADVNAQGGEYGNALQAAAYRKNEGIVKLLVNAGADVNAQ